MDVFTQDPASLVPRKLKQDHRADACVVLDPSLSRLDVAISRMGSASKSSRMKTVPLSFVLPVLPRSMLASFVTRPLPPARPTDFHRLTPVGANSKAATVHVARLLTTMESDAPTTALLEPGWFLSDTVGFGASWFCSPNSVGTLRGSYGKLFF